MAVLTSAIRPLWYFKCAECGMSYVADHLSALPLERHLRCHRHVNVQFLVDLVENWSKLEWQVRNGDRAS